MEPSLLREIKTDIGEGPLKNVVGRLGSSVDVILVTSVPGRDRVMAVRSVTPCLVAAQGRSLGDTMRAITALTGDPWDWLGGPYALVLDAQPLDAQRKSELEGYVAMKEFGRSLTPEQREQMKATDGLAVASLSPGQRKQLQTVTAALLARGGVPLDQVVLRRATGPGILGDSVFLYRQRASRENEFGMIMLP